MANYTIVQTTKIALQATHVNFFRRKPLNSMYKIFNRNSFCYKTIKFSSDNFFDPPNKSLYTPLLLTDPKYLGPNCRGRVKRLPEPYLGLFKLLLDGAAILQF